ERFPWELWQALDNPQRAEQAGQFRAELHNRIVAPLYPLAFLVLTFAYLCAPRTTRQSRAMSLITAIAAVAALRGIGFVGAISGGMLALVGLVDFVEMLRRSSRLNDVSALLVARIALYRVPFLAERVLPFAVNVAASFCYLNLSRRLELVVARSAGVSAWQF